MRCVNSRCYSYSAELATTPSACATLHRLHSCTAMALCHPPAAMHVIVNYLLYGGCAWVKQALYDSSIYV